MAHPAVRSSAANGPRRGEVRFAVDVRGSVKDTLIDIAHDQRRTLRAVCEDALTDYARRHWQREEELPTPVVKAKMHPTNAYAKATL